MVVFADLIPCYYMPMLSLLVEMDLTKCVWVRFVVSPGHVAKYPSLIALRKVES